MITNITDGNYLTITKDQLKRIQIDILDAVDAYCKENEIPYYLFAGTLIGAARHKGYIPWDDDIDICMRRNDYDQFFQEFNLNRNDSYQAISHKNTSGYYLAAGKVVDNRTVMQENSNSRITFGVYVDVFPMDDLPSDDKKLLQLNRKIDLWRKLLILKRLQVSKDRKWYKNLPVRMGHVILALFSYNYLIKKIEKIAKTYNGMVECNRLGDISVFSYGMREVFDLKDFQPEGKIEFEGKMYNCPGKYDVVLSKMYGDYMKLPPKEKQVSHHVYHAYWRGK